MTTTTKTEPKTSEPIGQWPPLAHLVHKDNLPAKDGDLALCGAKLMGLNDLDDSSHICEKCIKILRELDS